MTRRDFADLAATITERHAPPHLRERAFLRAYLALCEGRNPAEAVREFVVSKRISLDPLRYRV
jgi:hypothetical protein